MLSVLKPKHTVESVANEIACELSDGSIVLGEDLTHAQRSVQSSAPSTTASEPQASGNRARNADCGTRQYSHALFARCLTLWSSDSPMS